MSSRPRLHSRRSSGAEGRGRLSGRPDGGISPTDEGEVGRDSVRASEELTRARAARVGFGLGALTLLLGLLAGCATSSPEVASDERDKSACVRASVGYDDSSYSVPFGRLPYDIDRDAYRRCIEERGYHLPPSGIQAP
jgi:hypothetical protein